MAKNIVILLGIILLITPSYTIAEERIGFSVRKFRKSDEEALTKQLIEEQQKTTAALEGVVASQKSAEQSQKEATTVMKKVLLFQDKMLKQQKLQYKQTQEMNKQLLAILEELKNANTISGANNRQNTPNNP